MPEELHDVPRGRFVRARRAMWRVTLALGDRFLDVLEEDLKIVIREKDLFLGVALAVTGLLHFRTGKFCDGNSADYLSCTRPVAYYYYGAFEIFLVLVGVFFILLWYFKRHRK